MYYPKSQITSNLYTNGGEYIILSNGRDYIGYYFTTSDNKIFSLAFSVAALIALSIL